MFHAGPSPTIACIFAATSRPSMLTQRKTDDNPFEKAESVKTKNLLSVRIDPKKDNKKDKLSAGL